MGDFYSAIFGKRFKDNASNKEVVMVEKHSAIENTNDYWMVLWGGKCKVLQSL